MNKNYHTHTARCQHATGTEREYIEEAIKGGFLTLGFSDHVPVPFEDGYVSHIRMTVEETEGYVNTLKALQREYKNQIEIKIGYEMEYMEQLHEACLDNLRTYGYDYLILSQHFLDDEQSGIYVGRPTTEIRIVEQYVKQCIAGMETGEFIYLGHPDLVNYVGKDETGYYFLMKELCEAAKQLSIPLEWNILGMIEGRNYPSRAFFEIAAEVGNQIILGVDAHDKNAFSNSASIKKAEKMVQEYGLTIVPSLDL